MASVRRHEPAASPIHALVDLSGCSASAAAPALSSGFSNRTSSVCSSQCAVSCDGRRLALPAGWKSEPRRSTRAMTRSSRPQQRVRIWWSSSKVHNRRPMRSAVIIEASRPIRCSGSCIRDFQMPTGGASRVRRSSRRLPGIGRAPGSRDGARLLCHNGVCLSPCFVIRRELVGNMHPTLERWTDVRGVLADYAGACTQNRLSNRDLQSSGRTLASLPDGTAEFAASVARGTRSSSVSGRCASENGVLSSRSIRGRVSRVAAIRRSRTMAARRAQRRSLRERHGQGRPGPLRRPLRQARQGRDDALGPPRRRRLPRTRAALYAVGASSSMRPQIGSPRHFDYRSPGP